MIIQCADVATHPSWVRSRRICFSACHPERAQRAEGPLLQQKSELGRLAQQRKSDCYQP